MKESSGIDELMFLSTCNRVEFLLNTTSVTDKDFVKKFIFSVYPEIKNEDAEKIIWPPINADQRRSTQIRLVQRPRNGWTVIQ